MFSTYPNVLRDSLCKNNVIREAIETNLLNLQICINSSQSSTNKADKTRRININKHQIIKLSSCLLTLNNFICAFDFCFLPKYSTRNIQEQSHASFGLLLTKIFWL